MNETARKNPLGEKPLNQLLRQFAVPSIVAMLVSSLYNIVDQFFIGRSVGELGNAAAMLFSCGLVLSIITLLFLDALFVFGFRLGMAGAAAATVIGQVISGSMAIWFLSHCQTVKITKKHLIPRKDQVSRIMSLGAAPCSNQIAIEYPAGRTA